MPKAYWKRFAESVTGSAYKYRHDIFYRTGWNVVVLQVGFASILLVMVVASLNLLYDEIIVGLLNSIASTIASGGSPTYDSISIATSLEYEKQKNMVLTGAGILIAAAIFSWLITRMALSPTRNALDSQKQFVGNIAHELRTPLSIIKTNTEVALFNERLDADTMDILRSNVEELDRISNIINNLLSMSALLRPEKMAFTNVSLGAIIDRVTELLGDLATRKDVTLEAQKSAERAVWGNAVALEQIVMNIVKNAVNYTPAGGRVLIATDTDLTGKIELSVQDTGIGIHEKDLHYIFEPFYRGDQSRNRISGGSGLGLAIVAELVKLHKGTITMRSTPGHGTTVIISLPPSREKPKPKGSEHELAIDFSKIFKNGSAS